ALGLAGTAGAPPLPPGFPVMFPTPRPDEGNRRWGPSPGGDPPSPGPAAPACAAPPIGAPPLPPPTLVPKMHTPSTPSRRRLFPAAITTQTIIPTNLAVFSHHQTLAAIPLLGPLRIPY